MKKGMKYVLVTLLMVLMLVVGVSCNGDNKTPGDGTKYQKYDLGTEKLVAPEWLYGIFTGGIPVESGPAQSIILTIDATGITGFPSSILPASGDLNITNQYYVGYTYVLEYVLGSDEVELTVNRQTAETLWVSYYVNGQEMFSKITFERVQE